MKYFLTGISLIVIIVTFLFVSFNLGTKNYEDYSVDNITKNEIDQELKIYVEKFYRDLTNYGIEKKYPKEFILKFSNLDSYESTLNTHGVSFGINNDELVEIYINKSSWKNFNKSQRYYLVYHELCHDILDLDDLSSDEDNYGKIMYPSMSRYEKNDMNQFIDNLNTLLETY